MQDSYNIRLKQPILEPTERATKAATIAAGMGVSSEIVEKLLGSSGLLLKPQPIQFVNDIAAKFTAAGVEVEVVPHVQSVSSSAQPIAAPEKIKPPEAPNMTKATDLVFGQRPKGWISLRWKILPLAILPVCCLVVLG